MDGTEWDGCDAMGSDWSRCVCASLSTAWATLRPLSLAHRKVAVQIGPFLIIQEHKGSLVPGRSILRAAGLPRSEPRVAADSHLQLLANGRMVGAAFGKEHLP